MRRPGRRFATYATAVVAALSASTCCSKLLMADESAFGYAFPPVSFRFFEPNEDCQYDRIDFVFKDGTAHVTLWDLGADPNGKLKHMTGKPSPDRQGMTFTYGRAGCRIAVSVYPVK
jgi:hypothetical protein